jgi:L-serine dehydratase
MFSLVYNNVIYSIYQVSFMLSVFDMFTIGIGPSSSHTVGPMKAAKAFVAELAPLIEQGAVDELRVELYGSLAQTGKGHGTHKAIILGLEGHDPTTVDPSIVAGLIQRVKATEQLQVRGQALKFLRQHAWTFHYQKILDFHTNGMVFSALYQNKPVQQATYFSIGGGFIIQPTGDPKLDNSTVTYPFTNAAALLEMCQQQQLSISAIMHQHELQFCDATTIETKLWALWLVMKEAIERGYNTDGVLPGGLNVNRRAPNLYRQLQSQSTDPLSALDWVNMFAIAINEENAAGGRVVTAPTNGAAGIVPAVLAYIDRFVQPVTPPLCTQYLLTCAAIGMLYKKNASISGAEVGCQGEVGVACSMAAAGLAEIQGGNVEQVQNAAEIGMEHNLGLTCDPVGGLVQIPCIERNAIGAVKAINAAKLALKGDGQHKVSLDKVIRTMWETGKDMQTKYKETAEGGLAVNIIEC